MSRNQSSWSRGRLFGVAMVTVASISPSGLTEDLHGRVTAVSESGIEIAMQSTLWPRIDDLLRLAEDVPGIGMVEVEAPQARLDGATRDRAGVVADFQDPEGPPVLLASLKAGGLGINLTAADHVFILDPWWNPAA